ncbi:hypothetical protein Tco_1063460 [Tanacetum coccineum]
MRELEATGEHTTAEINAMVRGGKLRRHIPGVGPVMPGYVRSRLSYTAPVDRSRDVDFMMSLMRSDNRFADAFARPFPSDMSLGKILPRWHQFLDQKIRGAHFSLGIVAGERFAIELTPSTFPQRHVAGEKVGMLLGKASNVVVLLDYVCFK